MLLRELVSLSVKNLVRKTVTLSLNESEKVAVETMLREVGEGVCKFVSK